MAQMAAATDGPLRRLFEKPLPENPTLLEVLSACSTHMHQKKQLPAVDPASFTEIFGELHFQEKPDAAAAARLVLPPVLPHPPPARGTASWLDVTEAEKSKDDSSLDALLRPKPASAGGAGGVRRCASFCMKKSSASLLLCTEGLGSESTVDADDMVKDGDDAVAALRAGAREAEEAAAERARAGDGAAADAGLAGAGKEPPSFPPPIRSIGRGGRPCVCFRSFRAEGRFVLTQVVIPGKELLHASREGGRLRLQFAAAAGVGAEEELELGGQEDHEANRTCDACA